MDKKIREITLTGVGIAICFVATMYIKIPNPLDGYFNMGDGVIMLFAAILNPLNAFLVGGVGSALADFAGGYPHYIIFTLIIKGLEAIVISILFNKYGDKIKYIAYAIGSVIMVVGYFLAKWYLKANIFIALSGVFENVLQSLVGFVIAIILLPQIKKFSAKYR